jgi:hypothetical protein
LLRYTILLPDEDELQRTAERVGGTAVQDPSGNSLVLRV